MTTTKTTKKQELLNIFGIDYDSYGQVIPDIPVAPGWNSGNANFAALVPQDKNKLCLEVGSWTGGSAKTICSLLDPSSCLICCDTFLGSVEHFVEKQIAVPKFQHGRPALFEMFIKNTEEHKDKILPLQLTSSVVYDIFKHYNLSIDFVYIDGDHARAVVKEDVLRYYSLLAPGGVLLGDDYAIEGVKAGLEDTGLDYTMEHGQFIIRKP